MSLIQIRRERKNEIRGGPARPPSIWKLIAALILVALIIWKLSQAG